MAEISEESEQHLADDPRAKMLVVGLGASAGGIRALKDFFAHVPPQSGAAYVVILHLSPDHDSRLAEVLQTTAPMPVLQVTSNTPIEPNHVYVISPNRALTINDSVLEVADVTRSEQRRSPVDVFFRTLADSHGSRSVCVVLSGTGPNGSAGLKRVKEYGGLVIVQDPREAEYADMPRNAIATGLADLVLPIAEMPAKIAAYADHVHQDYDGPPAPAGAGGEHEPQEGVPDVLTALRVRSGHDFSNYKIATVHRRIDRRMNLRGVPTVAAYARLIRQEPDEAMALMKELLISVTNFFRDAGVWAAVEQRLIPQLFFHKGAQDQVRVWVPGCATGEEAYSIAMLLAEYAAASIDQPAIQVFATDLDQQAIATAREGVYTAAEVADVSEERLQRFFVRGSEGYRIRRDLRELVLFAHHNVIKDPPFSHLDLISCRNLLIYLNRSIQERVVETFHFALRPGGYLLLGTSESPDGMNDLFMRFDAAAHVYESRVVTSRLAPPLVDAAFTLPRQARAAEDRPADRMSAADLHLRLLEQYAPPSIIATEEHHVLHMSERAGRYLQLRGGEPSRDLLMLVRAELRPDLRTALHQASKSRTSVDVRGILVPLDDGPHRVDLSVKPVLREGDAARGFFLITFDESEATAEPPAPLVTLTSPAEPVTQQLEDELVRVKAQLRGIVEQYETQVEEAKASNEELQAMNEELRSAAEELETSKEELQSVNEELTTVNQELKIKIEELGLTNNDFQNFINATDIGTIFLDRALRVKFSTPRAREVFNLLDTDIGRPLSDITSRLRGEGVHHDVRTVLDRLRTVEREVATDDGRWHLMRMFPYRTSDNHIDGVVITFHDVTERRAAEQRVRQSEERLRMLIDGAIDYAIFTITETGIVDSWNAGAERMFGYRTDEIVGTDGAKLFTPEDREAGMPAAELAQARRTGRAADERYHVRKNGSRFYCSGVTQRLGGGGQGFAKIARDLTAQQTNADNLRHAHDELETRVLTRTKELEALVAEHQTAKNAVTSLLHRLVNAQESERLRIARDLHDHFGQQITTLRLALERTQKELPVGGNEIGRALALLAQIGRDLDFLAWELRPAVLDELGLAAALPRFVTEWAAHVGIHADCRFGEFQSGQLARDAEIAFYRVTQEALNNVSKHAHASRVDVVLASTGGKVVLVIEDDGVGFDPSDETAARGFGFAGMRERAALVGATLEIESAPGDGTSVFLRCPIRTAQGAGGDARVLA
jgi:two-component system, chemotaxis family, CheB/CheR fusion protein